MNSTALVKSPRVLDKDETGDSLFLLLPAELRLEIYKYSIIDSRRPRAADVHKNLLSAIWEDCPSPLLGVNKQIRAEVCGFLQRSPFTMRITWQDKKFDGLALSSFIAQQRKGYEDIPHLVVEIWPPRPDRPCDFLYIWDHLRKFRDDLRAVPQCARLDLVFLENEIASWSDHNGRPRHTVEPFHDMRVSWRHHKNDIEFILELFKCLTNVGKAHISLPDSLLGDGQNLELWTAAIEAEEFMTGVLKRTSAENRIAKSLELLWIVQNFQCLVRRLFPRMAASG